MNVRRFARHPLLGGRRVGRDPLAVETFQQLVSGQGQVQPAEQYFHPLRRYKEDRPDRQRRLPLMVQQFEVVLLFELGEQRVGTAAGRRGRQQDRVAVVRRQRLGGGGIEVPDEALGRPPTTALRRRQRGLLRDRQRHQVPAEAVADGAVAEQLGHAPLDMGPRGATMAALHRGGDPLELGADLGDGLGAARYRFQRSH
jgi:hypothetical protein